MVRLIISCKSQTAIANILEMVKDISVNTEIYVRLSDNNIINAIGSDGELRTYQGTTSKTINQALSRGGIIVLAPHTIYSIDESLLFQSNTVLEGNGATIKLAQGLPMWGYNGCPIKDEKAMLMILGNSASNVTIRNLIVDGSQSDYYPKVKLGTSCYNMATLIGCNGLIIENCTFKNGCNDAVLLNDCKNINIDNIIVNKCGHDGIYSYYVDGISVKNSTFLNRTNSSCRFYNVENGEFLNNECSTSGGGHTGLQLQGDLKNIYVAENYIKGLPYPGILSINAKMKNVVIENNKIEKCKSPGISVSGAVLRNNDVSY